MPGGDGDPTALGAGGSGFAPIAVAQHRPCCITTLGSWARSGRAAPHAAAVPTVALGSPSLWCRGSWWAGNHGPGSYLVWWQQGGGGWAELAEDPATAPSQRCKIKEACEGPGKTPGHGGGGGLPGPRGTLGGHQTPQGDPTDTALLRQTKLQPSEATVCIPVPGGRGRCIPRAPAHPPPTPAAPRRPQSHARPWQWGGPGDSAVLASPAPPGVAMVSPNYSSSSRTAWVRGEAAGAAALRGLWEPGLCSTAGRAEHPQSCRHPQLIRGAELGWPHQHFWCPVPPCSHTPRAPDTESPLQGEDLASPLLSYPQLVGTGDPASPPALPALGGHRSPCPGSRTVSPWGC